LATILGRWLKDAIGKLTTLDDYRRAAANGRGELIAIYLSTLGTSNLAKLAKKFDPHWPGATTDAPDVQRAHILSLIRRQRDPAEKPAARQPAMPIDRVLALSDPISRRAELAKHTPAQLKKAIKERHIHAGPLSSKASKTELIEHIQAALARGWPKTQSVLDESKY
jgi:hypothetical protein